MKIAEDILEKLRAQSLKIMLVESCTGGEVASQLTSIPGASQVFCGSLVVYREESKKKWLSISPSLLKKEGAVSLAITQKLAANGLKKTPEADWCIAITGHLGPDAPRSMDGLVFIVLKKRSLKSEPPTLIRKLDLRKILGKNARLKRRRAASQAVLSMVRSLLS